MISSFAPIIELPPLSHPDAWEDPILFDEINIPDIPSCVLPGDLGAFAKALSVATETAESIAVMMILGVISTAVAKRISISPKVGWYEPINIYTLISLPPANHKSWLLKACTHPLIEWEREQTLLQGPEIKRQYAEYKNKEKLLEYLRMKMVKEQDVEKQKALRQEICDLEVSLIKPPVLPILFVNDVTPESLANNTAEQGGRLAIFSDEGGILETLAGLYNHGSSNVDILLKGIDGGEMRIRRKDRFVHMNPYLTMVLAVQPTILRNFGEKRAFEGNGTLERFLYVLPRSKLGQRCHNTPAVPTTIQHAYHHTIHQLLNQYYQHEQDYQLTLSKEAFEFWHAFQRQVEIELAPTGRLHACLGWAGKICGYTLRLAGLLHIADRSLTTGIISAEVMQNALDLMEVLIDHALSAFNLMGFDQATADAKELYEWIQAQGKVHFTKTEITLAMRHKKVGKLERLQKGLDQLQERNLIKLQKIPTRKPTTVFRVHPSLIKNSE